jgi:hypothetical protein
MMEVDGISWEFTVYDGAVLVYTLYIPLYTFEIIVYSSTVDCDVAVISVWTTRLFHAHGHLWIYDLMGTYTI